MMLSVLVNVQGWVAVDVSVDDDYADGDEIPDEAIDAAVNRIGWSDSHFEVTSWQADPVDGRPGTGARA